MVRERMTVNRLNIADSGRKGAPFLVEGLESCYNGGQIAEIAYRYAVTGVLKKPDNGKWDETDDIVERGESVKSLRATICSEVLAETLPESINEYFRRVHSKAFVYVCEVGAVLKWYWMDSDSFRRFLEKFGELNERGCLRLKNNKTTLPKILHQWAIEK